MSRILAVLLLLSINGFSQDTLSIKDWKSFPLPKNRDTLISYNWSNTWWKVIVNNDEVCAFKKNTVTEDKLPFKIGTNQTEKIFNIRGDKTVLKVDEGYLVGANYGEWGGDFSWYSKNGNLHKKISGDQVLKFLVINQRIFALDGYGNILEIEKIKNEWSTKNYIKFSIDQTLISFALDNQNNFIVITADCLLKIDKERKITKIIENGFWRPYLYPTSIVIKNNIVYVGMPMGIFKYNLDAKTKEWLMPK